MHVAETQRVTLADLGFEEVQESRWKDPDMNNICQFTGVTLSRYLIELSRLNPGGAQPTDTIQCCTDESSGRWCCMFRLANTSMRLEF